MCDEILASHTRHITHFENFLTRVLSHKILDMNNLLKAQDISNFSDKNEDSMFGYGSKISSSFLCDRKSYHTHNTSHKIS